MKNKIILLNQEAFFDSTFLIPEKLMPFFESQVEIFKGKSNLFQFMVNSKHPAYNDRPVTRTGKTTYSPEGLNLKQVNFKPRNQDWERFRIIAQSMRVSMCLLFVTLLLLWDMFESDVTGVPVTPGKLSLLTSLTVGPAFTIIHLCRHRI